MKAQYLRDFVLTYCSIIYIIWLYTFPILPKTLTNEYICLHTNYIILGQVLLHLMIIKNQGSSINYVVKRDGQTVKKSRFLTTFTKNCRPERQTDCQKIAIFDGVVYGCPLIEYDENCPTQTWMDAFEKAKNVKKEIESAEALQRGPTLTKKYVYSILFSLSFLVHLLKIERT